ncbi:MAG TPA: hypothetical protein PLU33_06625 [Treponemataceae bacterium]|nr:hypothetical protein [Treponemataceae bacterium]HQL04798.1 hypothetical protein [Treponemataceae bacterium]
MKTLCHGNNDSGSIMMTAIVIILLLFLVVIPYMNIALIRCSSEKKRFDSVCRKIELHNAELGGHYEIN